MTSNYEQVLKQAILLPAVERQRLIDALSAMNGEAVEVDEQWLGVFNRVRGKYKGFLGSSESLQREKMMENLREESNYLSRLVRKEEERGG